MTISELHPSGLEVDKILALMINKSGEFSMPIQTSKRQIIEYQISYYLYSLAKRDVYVCVLREQK